MRKSANRILSIGAAAVMLAMAAGLLACSPTSGTSPDSRTDAPTAIGQNLGISSSGDNRAAAGDAAADSHEARYAAYLKKVEEYQSEYGAHAMATFQYGQEWSIGLAMVQLVDFNGDGDEELLLAYRDSGDSGADVSGYARDAYHVEAWGFENESVKQLHAGIPPAGDGGYMPVVLYGNSEAPEAKVVLYECDNNGIFGEGHEAREGFYGFDGGAFGLLFERTMAMENGKDSTNVSGPRAEMADEGGGSVNISSYSPTYYYLDGMMKPSSDSSIVDCRRVFQITDETIAKLKGESAASPSLTSSGDKLADSAYQSAAKYIEATSEEFIRAWYNDWTFEDGEMEINQTPIPERCLPYIAEGTELYSEFSDETNFYAGSGSRLSRGAALSVATIDTTVGDDHTVTVDVAFYGAQNTITQEMFDQIKDRPANRSTWTLTFDDSGKIIALENGVAAESGAEEKAARYESVISAYRSGLNSDTQPSDDAVNPEAWIAREYNKGRYAYALYDLNGDGSDELLIGLEEDTPVSEEGLEVYYRLYDLFTLDSGKPVRVLSDENMVSLGYRAFCVPCENNIIATGGSGGATYHVREYWRLGEKANEMSLSDRVTMDADEYTFESSDGRVEVLTGAQARSRYEDGVIGRYTPITKFVWHPLR